MADELELVKAKIIRLGAEVKGVLRGEGQLEAVPEFPTWVVYLVEGDPSYSLGRGCIGVHKFNGDMALSRSMLPNDETEAMPFVLLVIKKFAASVTLGGLCEHCLITHYSVGGWNYGREQQLYGVRFNFEVKVRHSGITVAVG